MIEGFDKEMDSLLRQAARGEIAQTFPAHLDADEISLFAENTLATKARARAVTHLADCAKCRKTLANVISLNAAAESETVHAAEEKSAAAAPRIPWYRRLFAFPNLAYAMGAAALVFSGFVAYVILQNATASQSSSVAQKEVISERSRGTGGATSDGETTPTETFSANTTSNSANSAPAAMSNASSAAASNAARTGSNSNANVALPALPQQTLPPDKELAKPAPENNYAPDAAANANVARMNQPSVTAAAAPVAPKDEAKLKSTARTKNEREDKSNQVLDQTVAEAQATPDAPAPKTAARKMMKPPPAGETRGVGGKTFRNVGGIWFDAAYASQPQTAIRRGSEDFRKLDSGLRSLAENLSGTIVVVWKNKAYRIQ